MKINALQKKKIYFQAPPGKAHTLRALLLSSLARGESKIYNPLLGKDQLHLINCLRGLGVEIDITEKYIKVLGSNGFFNPMTNTINAGESGVSMNILSAICSLTNNEIILTGAEGLLARPIQEVINGLRQLGCDIKYLEKEGFPPVLIRSSSINGGIVKMSGSKTSQYFSSLAIVAPFARTEVTLECIDEMTEKPYFDITIDMMSQYGVHAKNFDYKRITIPQNQEYKARDISVEGDFSSASFFMLGAAIGDAEIRITGLNKNSKQGDKAFVELMGDMGCNVQWNDNELTLIGNRLDSIEVNMSDIPDLVPPLAIAAAFANGTSKLCGVGHLVYKECNRLEAMIEGLTQMGISAYYKDDCLFVEGLGDASKMNGAEINTYNDHRIAMSFAIAGLVVPNQRIEDTKCVEKSFPDFWNQLNAFY